jgi:hypothetical protein
MSKQFNTNPKMNMNNNNSNNFTKRIPKCLTCEKAGLTGKALEHFTRKTSDPSSEIVCPTILGFKCGYCGNSGHSKGFCQIMKADQDRQERERYRQEREREARRAEEERQRQETQRQLNSNKFRVFEEEDEEDAELRAEADAKLRAEADAKIQEMEFPSLSKKGNAKPIQVVQQQFSKIASDAAYLPQPKPKPVAKPVVAVEEYYSDYENEYYEDDEIVIPDEDYEDTAKRRYFTPEHELVAPKVLITPDGRKLVEYVVEDCEF